MTSSTHYGFSQHEAALAAAEFLDEPLRDENFPDDFGGVDLFEQSTSSPLRAVRMTRILPTLLTVAYAGLSSAPTLADSLPQQWRWVSVRSNTASSSNRHAGLIPAVSAYDATQFGISDRVVAELEKLSDGWAGEGSVAPTAAMIHDIDLVLNTLPVEASMPDIEVDDEDGVVTLRWMSAPQTKSCSLVFRGDGKVTGIKSTVIPPRSVPWNASVRDDTKIALALDDAGVREAITG